MTPIQLVCGLQNPGAQYEKTRHNAGAWFIHALEQTYSLHFKHEKKLKAFLTTFTLAGETLRVMLPNTYMNESGQALLAVCQFYQIKPENLLVVHDDLDLLPGVIRLKIAGGHGGHNGLRDIIAKLGTHNFTRLRIGIGHPGHRDRVLNYVLGKPTSTEEEAISHVISNGMKQFENIILAPQKAMNHIHSGGGT